MLSDNETGVLARVTGLFSARGFQIQNITAGEINAAKHLSCISITTEGTPATIAQIKAQLEKIVAIRSVVNLTEAHGAVQREMMIVRVRRNAADHDVLVNALNELDARQIAADENSTCFELTGDGRAIHQYIERLNALGEVEIARSGIVGMSSVYIS
jgi:acetolactate synthase-1/3 small subunit